MDNQSQTAQPTKPISDDQELAKVLAGITNNVNNNMGFEETNPVNLTTPAVPPVTAPAFSVATEPAVAIAEPVNTAGTEPGMPIIGEPPVISNGFNYQEAASPTIPQVVQMPDPIAGNELDGIRKEALSELRPLVDRLDLSPEEKFDIYLLLLRSTDDTTLIAPAHEAAKNIADEPRRAQALLDVIKEIDFLSRTDQTIAS